MRRFLFIKNGFHWWKNEIIDADIHRNLIGTLDATSIMSCPLKHLLGADFSGTSWSEAILWYSFKTVT